MKEVGACKERCKGGEEGVRESRGREMWGHSGVVSGGVRVQGASKDKGNKYEWVEYRGKMKRVGWVRGVRVTYVKVQGMLTKRKT